MKPRIHIFLIIHLENIINTQYLWFFGLYIANRFRKFRCWTFNFLNISLIWLNSCWQNTQLLEHSIIFNWCHRFLSSRLWMILSLNWIPLSFHCIFQLRIYKVSLHIFIIIETFDFHSFIVYCRIINFILDSTTSFSVYCWWKTLWSHLRLS